jgi:hypothetical protein
MSVAGPVLPWQPVSQDFPDGHLSRRHHERQN